MASASEDLPRPVVFAGPSGVGKGTLIHMLMRRFPNDQFGFSVSHTTRQPREGEVDGVHYNFTTVEEMKQEIDDGKFIEHAEVHGNYYGTSVAGIDNVREARKVCILDIDVQGVENVKKSSLEPFYVFLSPPSLEELEQRLRRRGSEKEMDIIKRLSNSAKEMEYANQKGNFDRIFVNDDLDETFDELVDQFKEWYPHLKEAPRPVVICGPSGVGKGTLIELLMKQFPNDQFGFSVSHTTRKPREGEVDGVHYNFSTVEKIKQEIAEGKFIEHAEVHGNYYGTSVEAVESVQMAGKICVLDIDVQGAESVKKSSLKPIYIFIAPPSVKVLETRLRGRGSENEESLKKRLGNSFKELEYSEQKGNFDQIFVNDDLMNTLEAMVFAFKEWYPHLVEDESLAIATDEQRSCAEKKCIIS
eukprot:CAMPEP_0198292290 /NCGR_PEP_ID=MMETSP1449-20131203/11253_1 /TAXON_ID=420275 /ORGANISM="Attheya septentrionalis, Strain CCMP2084" /LENGTH=415 /DNA_ID=CAMNT_0043991177 /DNA_START=120 /DNA_END=1367 /DNA_ORIENTATION=+